MSGKRNRSAGHGYEVELAKRFRRFFPDIITSRAGNRSRDAQGIDLVNRDEHLNGRLPLNVQAKNVLLGKLQYQRVLDKMPREKGIINVIYHNATKKSGTKFMKQGEYVFMSSEDFELMLETYLATNLRSNEATQSTAD
jgi:hypothetical protein